MHLLRFSDYIKADVPHIPETKRLVRDRVSKKFVGTKAAGNDYDYNDEDDLIDSRSSIQIFFCATVKVKRICDVIILATLLVASLAAPQGNPNDITIVKQEEVNNIGVGGYHFSYEQSDGQKRDETAELRNEGTDDEELAVTGSFSFISPDGHTYRVDYTADKDGFHPNIQLVSK
ncbi:hypothetical protein HZH68_015933 [Vespula germanica]|uniref:Flexible cuticle protein 12 n=2 Tax=Vespula TaxID=7451 RepID=A0A834J2W9_VESGE|nr:hypothetical protein HZH68_015933 [Vespula germanica]